MERITTTHPAETELKNKKYSVISGGDILIPEKLDEDFQNLVNSWANLVKDKYLKDNASFRLRRFGLFYWNPNQNELHPLSSTEYFQSEEINTYAGGVTRQFAPLVEEICNSAVLHEIIKFDFDQFPTKEDQNNNPWEVDVHQFRIIGREEEVGEPTPEGVHHDGDDFNAIHLINRENAKGGINTVYDNDKELLASTTLIEPMDTVMVWDPHVMHGVSPIAPENPGEPAIRDVLVIGFNYKPDLKIPVN